MPPIELDSYEDYGLTPSRGGGGGGKKRTVFGEKGRLKKKQVEGKAGQFTHRQEARAHGEKSPVDEVNDVLRYVTDFPSYVKWVEKNINLPEIEPLETEMGNWEKFTASVHAGGSGRQTSRNGRARTHLITGIRARSEVGRRAFECEADVMAKIKARLETHLANIRILIGVKRDEKIGFSKLEEEILTRTAGL